MSTTENMLLNWYFSRKKLRMIRMIFDIGNWLWKSNFGTYWQLAINPKLKIQWFPLGMLILTFENSTTCIAILLNGGDLQVLWRRQMRMKTSFKNYRAVGIRDAGWGEFAPLDLDWDRKKNWGIKRPCHDPFVNPITNFQL